MKKLLLVFLFFLKLNSAFAEEENSLKKYYENVFLGEKKTVNYFGPLDARTVFSEDLGNLILLDDQFKNNYLNQNFEAESFRMHQFWFAKVLEKSTCPDEEYGNNLDYTRYLFRLVTLSYLFEEMRANHRVSQELGFGKNICPLSYNDIFAKCNPQSDDMKKFKERIYGKFVNEFEKVKYSSLSKKEIESWLELFHLSSKQTVDPTFARLHAWCDSQGKNCKTISVNDVKESIGQFCEKDRHLMQNLCNEKDDLQGISYVKAAEELVKTSNAFNLINTKGMGEDCLRRFVKLNARKEVYFSDLNTIYSSVMKSLQSDKVSYLQGSLFLPGALKEFDMKGLSDFLTALKPPKVVVAKVVKPKTKPKPIEKKVEVVKVAPRPEPTPEPIVVEAPPEIVIKEFERGIAVIKEGKQERVVLDMDKFRDDYEFTSKMISNLSQPIKKFQTRQALTDMRDYDKFGTKEAPVGIIFLKFLIDTDNHQGIYNVINVLGDKFFLQNDFDDVNVPVYAEIRNDASTHNRWQITMLRDEPKKKEAK